MDLIFQSATYLCMVYKSRIIFKWLKNQKDYFMIHEIYMKFNFSAYKKVIELGTYLSVENCPAYTMLYI